MAASTYLVALAVLAVGLPGVAQELDPEQSALIEQTREAALRYASSLPDFICTEIVQRAQDPRGDGRWKAVDKLTVKLSYSDHKEDYKLLKINGKDTQLDYFYMGGALTTGEFGTRLYAVFDPRSKAEFRWKGWGTLHKHRVARFTYRIVQAHTSYQIQYSTVRGEPTSILVPYHGEVFVDAETHMVRRLTQQAEIPPDFPITANECSVDYDDADVGGRQYLLPARAFVKTRSGRYAAENNIEFRDYRKFQTESTITFEPAAGK